MVEHYPLQWPPGWPRTSEKKRERARFDTPRAKAIANLHTELARLGAKKVVVSTNVETYEKGGRKIPYANQTVEDPGVAVYFELQGQEQCIPCDKWTYVKDNIHAVGKTIEALRGLERWGAKEIMEAAFRGFKALPSPDQVFEMPQMKPWYDVLGVVPEAPMSVRKAAYKAQAKYAHPDTPEGSTAKWETLRRAAEEAGIL